MSMPWASALGKRCKSRLSRGDTTGSPYYGRCDLAPHARTTAHALERGFDTVYWVVSVKGS